MANVNSVVARLAARTLVEKLEIGVPLSPSEATEAGYCITCLAAYIPYAREERTACVICTSMDIVDYTLPFVKFCNTHLKNMVEANRRADNHCVQCSAEGHARVAVWGGRCYTHLVD